MNKWKAFERHDFNDRISKSSKAREAFEKDFMNTSAPAIMAQRLDSALSHKVLCTTSTENIAHVQGTPVPGDQIFVARGASVPLVILAADADESYDETIREHQVSELCSFVGGAYVDRIRDGEVIELLPKTDMPDRSYKEDVYLI